MRSILRKVSGWLDFFRSVRGRLVEVEGTKRKLAGLQRELYRLRAMMKRLEGKPIHVAFVCHNPSLWGKIAPLCKALMADPAFEVSVIAVPYRHGSFGDEEFHDGGMGAYLRTEKGIEVIDGFDAETGEWLDLRGLAPDYVFFQTPYDSQFPESYTSDQVSTHARVCYVPYYGILIFDGEVESITHPGGFFKNVHMTFVGHANEHRDLLGRFSGVLNRDQVILAGSPMIDRLQRDQAPKGAAWNLERSDTVKRILWTPRWRTEEGNCHFFDYKNYFLDLARGNAEVDFLFRPHPLCLQNFATTGEFPRAAQETMIADYARLPNAGIDASEDYQDIFLSSDILVSDMSSMTAEYMITGKPVVYTRRVDSFNELGRELAKGYYHVHNQKELDEVLKMLMRGEDPLRESRKEIVERMFHLPPEGASECIKRVLREEFVPGADGGRLARGGSSEG